MDSQKKQTTQLVEPVELNDFIDYLNKICPILLDISQEQFGTSINEEKNKMDRFIKENKLPVMFISRIEKTNELEGEKAQTIIEFSFDVSFSKVTVYNLALIKKSPDSGLEKSKSLSSQLQIINIGEGSPFETIHSYIHYTLAPYFRDFMDKEFDTQRSQVTGVSSVKKKIEELERSLYNCKQNIQIEPVSFTYHPEIINAYKKSEESGEQFRVESLDPKLITDNNFVNSLTSIATGWQKSITKVTRLPRIDEMPQNGETIQEVQFWVELERELENIDTQLKSPMSQITIGVLKQAKKFFITQPFDTDIVMKSALEKAADYKILMKDFPIQELLTSSDISQVPKAITDIFEHMIKMKKSSKYPIERYIRLIEALSRDLCNRVDYILQSKRLMYIDYHLFEKIIAAAKQVFQVWENQFETFKDFLRELSKQRSKDRMASILPNINHKPLEEKINETSTFRKQHEELSNVVKRVLGSSTSIGKQSLSEIANAYEEVKDFAPLSPNSDPDQWKDAVKRYESRIDRVESDITSKLRDKLGKAKNANEMFRVFSKFNALFVRPRIRGAIQEYQQQLIKQVKADIENLHEQQKNSYSSSTAFGMSKLRDLPPVAGAIMWARQLDRQLTQYLKRVEDILGEAWHNDVEGKRLKEDGDNFRQKLREVIDSTFNKWVENTQQKNFEVTGQLLEVKKKGKKFVLDIHFDDHIITLFKEVRNLQWLGFRIPFNINMHSSSAKQVYPFAVSLKEIIRSYQQSCGQIEKDFDPLVAIFHKQVQQILSEGFSLRWESMSKLDPFVNNLFAAVNTFQQKVSLVVTKNGEINKRITSLDTCTFSKQSFSVILKDIQELVDELNLASFSNLESWTETLSKIIEEKLVKRLEEAVKAWVDLYEDQKENEGTNINQKFSKSNPSRRQQKEEVQNPSYPTPHLQNTTHEIIIRDQVMILEPPLEFARHSWISQFSQWIGVVCDQNRIKSSRYDTTLTLGSDQSNNATHRELLSKLDPNLLKKAYDMIETKINEAKIYSEDWLQYQALWDMEASTVWSTIGEDLSRWEKLLLEVKQSRRTFDTTNTFRNFGPIVVDFKQVQSNVNNKYDYWQKEILNHFGERLGSAMGSFYEKISGARSEMEQHNVDMETAEAAVNFILEIQDMQKNVEKWQIQLNLFRSSQQLLIKQRFAFPKDWLEFDTIEAEWSAFLEILERKNTAINNQIPILQEKIITEANSVDSKTELCLKEWTEKRPSGSVKFDEALNTIALFEGRVKNLRAQVEKVEKARIALNLGSNFTLKNTPKLIPLEEELKDLHDVWSELALIWKQIDEMKETPWAAIVPRKIRRNLDDLLEKLKNMPLKIRQYEAYESVRAKLRDYLDGNAIVIDLKSEALRDRHWKKLRNELNATWVHTQLILGDIWDSDLKANAVLFKSVIQTAQGEMALEEFIKQIKEYWTGFEIDLVNYQNKCKLIRGWDDLFLKIGDHLNSVSAMKMSPYYKVFEEEAQNWEDKLNRLFSLFDVWIDVQRRWVYLEGIFAGSAEIAQLLPVESSRFRSINTEFLNMMRQVSNLRLILNVLAIEGIQKTLERIADLLTKIQKALGEYLEKQRAAFPRFYFVGDEDLLEIIGNSKDILKIQKHFRKMFAGLASVTTNEEVTTILGMSSAQGEIIPFSKPILQKGRKIDEWLTNLEEEMKLSLSTKLGESVEQLSQVYPQIGTDQSSNYLKWVDENPAQLVVLSAEIMWCRNIESSLTEIEKDKNKNLEPVLQSIIKNLELLAENVMLDLPAILRNKYEQLITELVHQRDSTRLMISSNVRSPKDFSWLYQIRYYYNSNEKDLLKRCTIEMANAQFYYGFEYLGVSDRLVQTPLTDRCYLTLTQALQSRLGGSPFGPAGTGKTETVKQLGQQLGRFVLVFCCDENFDYQAMGRIFIGLCMCGAWGCFDEFNRLEERILSAVSQQIQTIQIGLKSNSQQVEVAGKNINLNQDMGIFITMNPGYAGRSNLPDNLKQLFRGIAMIKPDTVLIGQVMLFSQGFKTAERLSGKIVPLFKLCEEQLSDQSHYDFGLRALKSVLVSAGNLKRHHKDSKKEESIENSEQNILIQSVCENIIPKLVADDIPLLHSLLRDVFPGASLVPLEMVELKKHIENICKAEFLTPNEFWIEKMMQLYQTQLLRHGVMMVGPSGSGKSSAWRTLLKALERYDGIESVSYKIDPKAMSKDLLFGSLEPTTREWSDGLFTHTLRKIIDNLRGEANKRHWIVFDGDVDPEWVENLNSVLDDNKLLTLPNGERLSLPPNVRIMFEVENLKYATLATVSRCGMIWFSEQVVSVDMVIQHYIEKLKESPLDEQERESYLLKRAAAQEKGENAPPPTEGMLVQIDSINSIQKYFAPKELVINSLDYAAKKTHIMDFTKLRSLVSMFSLLNKGILYIIEYNREHQDFKMEQEKIEKYMFNRLIFSLLWGFGGSMGSEERIDYGKFLAGISTKPVPNDEKIPLIDYFPSLEDGEWHLWETKVPTLEIETHKAASPDVVIPTVDTVRHQEVIYSWLTEHKPLLLCGPPGSGKTMTLFNTLKLLDNADLVSLNFSSATTPELLLKTFDHHCEYKNTPKGTVLKPHSPGRWLIIFCDEINLPETDKYGTQRIITFIRQLTENNGFWRTKDHQWIELERIQFVGACNPPTDPGRVPLTHRFLRFSPLILVDFPTAPALKQIYGTFNRALMKLLPEHRGEAKTLTEAMVEFYTACQKRFTTDMHAHYIFSPRELSRWIRSLYEAIKLMEAATLDGIVRLWVHEGLRLFQDRLVELEERRWVDKKIDEIALRHFPSIDQEKTLKRPILFSKWLTKEYVNVERDDLRQYIRAKLKVFYEEELDVKLVLFNEVLDHILRIDRVFQQPQGHALLIGVSGGGKTVLSRFVAWMNGLSIFTIKVNNRYSADDFKEDLRHVMIRTGCKEEKVCFIFDESNVLESNFLELMNTLLASGDVPGLYEGDEYSALMQQCKEGISRNNLMIDNEEEMYKWFVDNVRKNLHVVFTMNPASPDFHNRSATSPALFNRCVLDWFGDWSNTALFQVGSEFTRNVDLDDTSYIAPSFFPNLDDLELPKTITHRDSVISSLVYIHQTINTANKVLLKRTGRQNYVTPRHYLDFIKQFVDLVNEKRNQLEEQQLHLNTGLRKLKETEEQVTNLQISLNEKTKELNEKKSRANEKLKQMVEDQQIAEQKKRAAEEMSGKLEIKDKEIMEKKEVAYSDLQKAEPAIEEAKNSVSSIKAAHLQELRNLRQPPQMIENVMSAVCLMLGKVTPNWEAVKKVLIEKDFITSIVNFDSNKISEQLRNELDKKYLSNPEFNFENAQRASKACGPLVKWIRAQVEYTRILNRVQPLKEEVERLENAAKDVKEQFSQEKKKIDELEEKISIYKEEYATLIREAELLKTEMELVQQKVERSQNLLKNLSSESIRWNEQSRSFIDQMSTIVGDNILSSAFLAYIGFFDQHYRRSLMQQWQDRLTECKIKFRENTSVIEYLSHPDERMTWRENSLPADDLSTENAIMLKRFNRYPLMIDPSGQAIEFLMNQFADKKIIKTSFLDSSFMKNLESALRFGCPIVVQDVENIDPVLNPILNKEIRKTGGRVLITLGDQDVDFSPSFTIFLTTRDQTAHFTPDLCSRVTFVNFTVTRSGLQAQSLNELLKSERPDIEQKRTDILKQQGEFRVKLRSLEQSLLDALNNSKGKSILEDDLVMKTLETLKNDSNLVEKRIEESKGVMEELSRTSVIYEPLAHACSSIYFAIEQLSSVHFLYQYSLKFFLDLFYSVLSKNSNLEGVKDEKKRIQILTNDIFNITYDRVQRSLFNEHKLTLALKLSTIYLRGSPDQIDQDQLEFLLRGGEKIGLELKNKKELVEKRAILNGTQARFLAELVKIPLFSNLEQQILDNEEEWRSYLSLSNAPVPQSLKLNSVPQNKSEKIVQSLANLLLAKCLRPDRVLATVSIYINSIFGDQFLFPKELPWENIVSLEHTNLKSPFLLCATPGLDPSTTVDDISSKTKNQLKSIALGSAEGFEMADKAIAHCSKNGGWVMLKNIHLAPAWLVTLEKKLHNLEPHHDFRLFLTSEIHPKLPANLLRQSRIFTFSPPPGVKASLLKNLNQIPALRMDKEPTERSRLHFMLAWLHTIVTERLRYAPLGWSKTFEFNDSDYKCALETIDYWIESKAQGRKHISPEDIPWVAIRTLLGQTVYGGRIDNRIDQRLLESFLEKLFTPACFDTNFSLVQTDNFTLNAPEGSTKKHFQQWSETLPSTETPAWLGLPENAELLLLTNKGKEALIKLLKMQSIEDDISDQDESTTVEESEQVVSSGQESEEHDIPNRPQWMIILQTAVDQWINILPQPLKLLEVNSENIKNPMWRFYEREIKLGSDLLNKLKKDLGQLRQVCFGKLKQTNYLRELISNIQKGEIPKSWGSYYNIPSSTALNIWFIDVVKRIEQLNRISKLTNYDDCEIWLGGLFNPDAFITATRQSAAQSNGWSLENLELHVEILDQDQPKVDTNSASFIVRGFSLQGASWEYQTKHLSFSNDTEVKLKPCLLSWKNTENLTEENSELVDLPVYLNDTRNQLLFSLKLSNKPSTNPSIFYRRGAAILIWTQEI
eukprot:TRINITY_DN2760_c1_g1_i1.p1 TRINITY_DN2760_c1_g1~~TRINITY_DN2760_c1_g1_i1.p1  ORF type:complete len:4604 (+),score=1553.39 TRINITY_DN2760_c1_g1_i1:76-13887(+)